MEPEELKKYPPPKEITMEQLWDLFEKLNTSIRNMKGTVEAPQEHSLNTRLDDLSDVLSVMEMKYNTMANLVIRQEQEIKELRSELKEVRKSASSRNVKIRGIVQSLSETKSELKEKVASFFKDTMEIEQDVLFSDAYRIGSPAANDRPVMVKLKKAEDKGVIFKHSSKLQGKLNVKRRLFFVDNDLDPETAENRRLFQEMKKENKENDLKLKLQMRNEKIVVNNKVITKKVHSPSARELLKITDAERKDVMNIKLTAMKEHQEQGSDYYSYIQKARSPEEVQKGLIKLRIKHGDATHISCAYRLENAVGPFHQEGHDDREFGIGRAILRVVKRKELKNICVYIVRYFGGVKLGTRRFKIAEMLTESAIDNYNQKARAMRSKMFRADSQESLCSVLSALSYEKDEDDDQTDVVSITGEEDSGTTTAQGQG